MSTANASPVWVWCPVDSAQSDSFKHPCQIPRNDIVAAKSAFTDLIKGPRAARIIPAKLIKIQGTVCVISEGGTTREVPRHLVLPWYEGLLLLEELEKEDSANQHIPASWMIAELREVLESERSKARKISAALYTEKRLKTTAVTSGHYTDSSGKVSAYRRENLKAEDTSIPAEGDAQGPEFFKMREVLEYLPPWEAFCHIKCGFYQDFYQIQWEYPFSLISYSNAENGCEGMKGVTWEPDECMPDSLDSFRVSAKQAWINKRRALEQKAEADGDDRPVKRLKSTTEPKPLKTKRRDWVPLERDLLDCRLGHDFAPPENGTDLAGIRSGWPKKPEDYPKGYGCAMPPGFCGDRCDCMDDARAQNYWEVHKPWLEDRTRSEQAKAALDTFSQQSRFVWKRGQNSKKAFLQGRHDNFVERAHPKAAMALASSISLALAAAVKRISIDALEFLIDRAGCRGIRSRD